MNALAMAPASILSVMDDGELFGRMFAAPTWKRWRAFLRAVFALPSPDDETLAWYRAHTGRQEWPGLAFKEVCCVIGRRGGKSRVLALIAVYLATCRQYADYLAPGEVVTIPIVAADRRQARGIFRYVRGMLQSVDMLANLIESETADTITLNNAVVIEITTASFRATRGGTYGAILTDEVAFWRDENSANPDEEIIKALRPGMATIPGAILLIASSPYRKSGLLWKTYARHYGKDGARVLVWKGTSLEMNPSLDPAVVEEAFADDAESAAAEYGAEFRSDLSDFVPRDVVDACTARGVFEIPYLSGMSYRGFVDPSGGTGSDSMTLAIAHREKDRAILDCVREIRPPFSPEAATIDFATTLKSYRVSRVTGDRYAGEWPRERFREHGITYELSDQPKSTIYQNMLPVLNSGRAQLLDMPRLASQLCGLERRTSRSGRDSIDHAPGAHDDVGNAAAGALLLVAKRKGPIVFDAETLAAI